MTLPTTPTRTPADHRPRSSGLPSAPTVDGLPDRPRRRGGRIAVAAAGGALLLGAAGAVAFGVHVAGSLERDSVSRSFAGVREVVIEVDEGAVSLRTTAGPEVTVDAVRHWTPGYEPALGGAVVDGVLRLTSDCEDFNLGCETEQDIAVPAGVAISVHTVGGPIEAVDLDTPRFSGSTVGGPVTASFVRPPDDVRVETVAGPVRVTVPAGSYRVSADTTVGPVTIGVDHDPAAPRRISASTVTGPVDVLAG
jgi:hypothetical protein